MKCTVASAADPRVRLRSSRSFAGFVANNESDSLFLNTLYNLIEEHHFRLRSTGSPADRIVVDDVSKDSDGNITSIQLSF